jgi:hypothetical protein
MKQPFKNNGASELSLEARQLVHESIEHWIRMRGMTCKELMEATFKDRPFSDGCPLCLEYLNEKCRECPVAKKAKLPHCKNTPWNDAHKIWWNMKKAWNLEEATSDMQPWFDACNAEIAFLYSLLEVQALTPLRLPLEERLVKAFLTEAEADIKEVELRQGKTVKTYYTVRLTQSAYVVATVFGIERREHWSARLEVENCLPQALRREAVVLLFPELMELYYKE